MSESGRTYRRPFKGHAVEASEVRAWTATRTQHNDAPLIASELFTAILGSGADLIEMQLSTAGVRLRITAIGTAPLPVLHSHGPGRQLVVALSRATGATDDAHGLWAELWSTP